MSIWHTIKDKENASLSGDKKTIEIMFMEDYNGANYVDIPIEFIEEIMQANRAETLVMPKIAEGKKEQFDKMIRDYTNDLIFGKQTQVMTDMLNFTKKLWDFVNDSNFTA